MPSDAVGSTWLPTPSQLRLLTWILACAEDFDQLFEAIIAVKAHTNVFNSARALRIVAALALERLADISGTEEASVVQEQSA